MTVSRAYLARVALASVALLSPVAGSAAAPRAAAPQAVALSPEDLARAEILAKTLCQQIIQLTPRVAAEQVEAAVIYSLSQSQQSLALQQAALDRTSYICRLGVNATAGLRNARLALLRGATSGTAGLTTARGTGGGGTGNGSSSFTSPAIAVGGGSVNYTTTNAR